MSDPLTKPDEGADAWADPHAFREEFRRRLAEKGIFVRLRLTDTEWEPPILFPVSADEASAMVIGMRRDAD
jgi:hypothetical protein